MTQKDSFKNAMCISHLYCFCFCFLFVSLMSNSSLSLSSRPRDEEGKNTHLLVSVVVCRENFYLGGKKNERTWRKTTSSGGLGPLVRRFRSRLELLQTGEVVVGIQAPTPRIRGVLGSRLHRRRSVGLRPTRSGRQLGGEPLACGLHISPRTEATAVSNTH